MNEYCDQHMKSLTDITEMKSDVKYIRQKVDERDIRYDRHIEEGERPGGIRDIVKDLQHEVSVLKKEKWARLIVAAFVGGLLARLAPDVIGNIAQYIIGIFIK